MVFASSLLLALAPLPALPGGAPSGEDWLRLDRELDTLATSIAPQTEPGVRVGGLIRSSFDLSSDDIFAPSAGTDLGGFHVQDVIFWMEGSVGNMDLRISMDGASNTAWPPTDPSSGIGDFEVQDAYGRWNLNEQFRVYMGQFKCPVLMSSQVWNGNLLFIDRTRLGQMFDVYQAGTAATFDTERLHFKLAVQNGADGVADEFGIVARGEFKLGAGAKEYEGAYGTDGGTNATIGAAYFNDGSQDTGGTEMGTAIAVDGYAQLGHISLHAEIVDMDEELAGHMGLTGGTEDAMPFSATAGFLLPAETIELALRYQDMDDDVGTTAIGGGVNYYSHGHAAKWQFNVSQLDDDNDDGMIIQLGLAVGV